MSELSPMSWTSLLVRSPFLTDMERKQSRAETISPWLTFLASMAWSRTFLSPYSWMIFLMAWQNSWRLPWSLSQRQLTMNSASSWWFTQRQMLIQICQLRIYLCHLPKVHHVVREHPVDLQRLNLELVQLHLVHLEVERQRQRDLLRTAPPRQHQDDVPACPQRPLQDLLQRRLYVLLQRKRFVRCVLRVDVKHIRLHLRVKIHRLEPHLNELHLRLHRVHSSVVHAVLDLRLVLVHPHHVQQLFLQRHLDRKSPAVAVRIPNHDVVRDATPLRQVLQNCFRDGSPQLEGLDFDSSIELREVHFGRGGLVQRAARLSLEQVDKEVLLSEANEGLIGAFGGISQQAQLILLLDGFLRLDADSVDQRCLVGLVFLLVLVVHAAEDLEDPGRPVVDGLVHAEQLNINMSDYRINSNYILQLSRMNNYYLTQITKSSDSSLRKRYQLRSPQIRKISEKKPLNIFKQDYYIPPESILLIAKGISLCRSSHQQKRNSQPRPNYNFSLDYKPHFQMHHIVIDTKRESTHQAKKRYYQFRESGDDNYTYFIGSGNNAELVARVMQARQGWKETSPINSIFNFRWTQTDFGFNFNRLTSNSGVLQVFNHFPNHRQISEKANLIHNLTFYAEHKKLNLFELTPITFIIDLQKETAELQFTRFLTFFSGSHKLWKTRFRQFILNPNQEKSSKYLANPFTKPKMHPSFGTKQIWLLKPSDLNRGRGIQLFDSLEQLEKIFQEETSSQNQSKISSHEFVIQKYIEKPLLVENRKFDIRVWVLVTQSLNVYVFSEGYLRTSTEQFNLENISDAYIHLTNNAVQQNSKNYGQFEQGNQLSFKQFDQILHKMNRGGVFYDKLWPSMKQLIQLTFQAIKKSFLLKEYKYCFELFGYDFIIDDLLNVWLIEVNTNPCLEESSDLLKQLMPRMINDAFKLTIDQQIFKKTKVSEKFPVEGYEDERNMWELLLNINRS